VSQRRSPFAVREAVEADATELGEFRCATGPWYEEEVEAFIRSRALRTAERAGDAYRLLVVREEGRLIACAAHLREGLLQKKRERLLLAVRLQLLGIAVADQGRRLEDGSRLSDAILKTVITDALEVWEAHVFTAIVAEDNLRSIALCERNGLSSQVRYDRRHVRLTGTFSPASDASTAG
jgi:ribosomal protein S18 acetylase RimI-like enzyme